MRFRPIAYPLPNGSGFGIPNVRRTWRATPLKERAERPTRDPQGSPEALQVIVVG